MKLFKNRKFDDLEKYEKERIDRINKNNKRNNDNLWDKYYDGTNKEIEVPNISIYNYFKDHSINYINSVALNYFGSTITYKELLNKINICANALKNSGVRQGDVVTICMANTPEAVIAFFAINKIGAISNMVHPLSSQEEIKNSIIDTKSVLLIAINMCYENIKNIINETDIYKVIVVSPKDSMPTLLSIGYLLLKDTKGIPNNEEFISWKRFIERGTISTIDSNPIFVSNSDAIYLHSGGTTGKPKNIVLTNENVTSVMEQAKIIFPKLGIGDIFLSILPLFHCFGLVVCVCAPLCLGSTAVLVPQFDAKRFDKLIKKYKPTILTGVPTLFEALITNPYMYDVDMSYVKYIISGGDSLTPEKNKQVNNFFREHNCNETIIQGYGMTETTGPSVAGALGSDKLGSVGIPLPSNKVKIIDIETKEEKKTREIGEICITGPSIMKEYLNNKEETDNIKKVHPDGLKWIHTGDLGYLDEDGVLFYVQRLKRMLIVSGYNVYPSHVENIIMEHEKVKLCGVIGVPHPYKVEVPKAFIVLKEGYESNEETLEEIKEHCKKKLAKYMIPKYFVFRDDLPKTMVGKIDYRSLEKEE